jgi:hypothetical protein
MAVHDHKEESNASAGGQCVAYSFLHLLELDRGHKAPAPKERACRPSGHMIIHYHSKKGVCGFFL